MNNIVQLFILILFCAIGTCTFSQKSPFVENTSVLKDFCAIMDHDPDKAVIQCLLSDFFRECEFKLRNFTQRDVEITLLIRKDDFFFIADNKSNDLIKTTELGDYHNIVINNEQGKCLNSNIWNPKDKYVTSYYYRLDYEKASIWTIIKVLKFSSEGVN